MYFRKYENTYASFKSHYMQFIFFRVYYPLPNGNWSDVQNRIFVQTSSLSQIYLELRTLQLFNNLIILKFFLWNWAITGTPEKILLK